MLEWFGVEFNLSSTPNQFNAYGLRWIHEHPNKTLIHIYLDELECKIISIHLNTLIQMAKQILGWNPLLPSVSKNCGQKNCCHVMHNLWPVGRAANHLLCRLASVPLHCNGREKLSNIYRKR